MSIIRKNRFVSSTIKPRIQEKERQNRPCRYCDSTTCSVTIDTLQLGFHSDREIQDCLDRQRSLVLSLIEDEYYEEALDLIKDLSPLWMVLSRSQKFISLQNHMEALKRVLLRGFSEKHREKYVVLPSDLRAMPQLLNT